MTRDDAAPLVDTRGMRCPWPALRLARAMRTAKQVSLLADDPQAAREIAALAASQGWRIEGGEDAHGMGRWQVRRD